MCVEPKDLLDKVYRWDGFDKEMCASNQASRLFILSSCCICPRIPHTEKERERESTGYHIQRGREGGREGGREYRIHIQGEREREIER
jgi:hypothetical protein